MLKRLILAAMLLFFHFALPLPVQGQKSAPATNDSQKQPSPSEMKQSAEEEILSVSRHSIKIKGETVNYVATAGRLALKDESGKIKANIFFTAYTIDQSVEKIKRPLMFAFNGGPGASSVWLHLGAIGPKRVLTDDSGGGEPPPYTLVDNEYSWLPFTDLVFIDPVGTGYSRATQEEHGKGFYGIKEDIQSVGEFIRLYTTKFDRWSSPKYMVGESYGTFRAIGLIDHLYENFGMEFNGIALISLAIDLQTISFNLGNDLPYILFLPSYAATAWFHKKLSPDLQENFQKTLTEAENWTLRELAPALAQGDALSAEERKKVLEGLSRYTGLSQPVLENSNLRVNRSTFQGELLRTENLSLALMDGRRTRQGRSGGFLSDPGMVATVGPYVSTVNAYIRNELRYESDLPYVFLSEQVNSDWNWGSGITGYASVLETLQKALRRDKRLKIYATGGYFDLNTPYFGTKYLLNHLGLDPSQRANIKMAFYDGGHMLYTNVKSLEMLTADVSSFLVGAKAKR